MLLLRVLKCLSRSAALVHFDNGTIDPVWNITEPKGDLFKSGIPIRYSYASTLSKIQGYTRDALAVFPFLNVKGAAYVAVTRLRALTDLWWITDPSMRFVVPR